MCLSPPSLPREGDRGIVLSCDPGQACSLLLCINTWLFADCCLVPPAGVLPRAETKLTGTVLVSCLCSVSAPRDRDALTTVAVLLSTLQLLR